MANSFLYKDKQMNVGDTIAISYKLKEQGKERVQIFEGILIKIRGKNENKMFTVRKSSKSGIGVERIIPLNSPYIENIKSVKKSNFRKATAYFIRDLSAQHLRDKLYRQPHA